MTWVIGRICEEFHCLPEAAYLAWQAAPVGFFDELLAYRSYARAKALVDAAEDEKSLPNSPIVEQVLDIEFELQHEALRARRRAAES